MPMERFILIAISVAAVISLFYIPKPYYRLALISFLAFEATTWASMIILVQIGEIAFPVRTFARATQAGFLQNFICYPVIYAWFMITYRNRATLTGKLLHYIVFISAIVWFIYFTSMYTELEEFLTGTPYTQLIRLYLSFAFQFALCHLYITWLNKKINFLTGM